MRTRVSRKGKKIVAMVLAFAMVLPLTWSQTVVAKAADGDVSQLICLKVHTSDSTNSTNATDTKLKLEPGEEIQIDIKAMQAMQITKIEGNLTFSSDLYSTSQLLDIFSVESVASPSGRSYGGQVPLIEGVGYKIEIHDLYSRGDTFAQNATIATITLKVSKSIDKVRVILNNLDMAVRLAGQTTDIEETTSLTTLDLQNELANNHKVVFEMPQGITGKVSNKYTTEKIEVPVRITENTGFCGVVISFKYDEEYLQFYDYQLSSEAAKYLKIQTVNASLNLLSGVVQLAFAAETDTHFTGDFLTLRFSANADESLVDKGVSPKIVPTVQELNNISEMSIAKGNMKAEFESGKQQSEIKLEKGKQLGDVNMDGNINLVDVAWVLQSYNGLRVLTSEQKTLADVNGDGKVSLVDAILILKYVNKEISSFPSKK